MPAAELSDLLRKHDRERQCRAQVASLPAGYAPPRTESADEPAMSAVLGTRAVA